MTEHSTVQEPHACCATKSEQPRNKVCYRPHVDILEQPQELWLVADMPGLRSEDIDIHFEGNELTLYGRLQPQPEPSGNRLLTEYGVGDYQRKFRVSEEVDPTRITATYDGGVLTVRLPKVAAAQPRKIAVQAG